MTLSPKVETIIIWQGWGYPRQRNCSWDSKARLRIWEFPDKTVVVFSDLNEEDAGTSITNSVENIATLTRLHFELSGTILWFEHYPYHNYSKKQKRQCGFQENVSQVFLEEGENGDYKNPPVWSYVPLEDVAQRGISLDMSGVESLSKTRLVTPLDQAFSKVTIA